MKKLIIGIILITVTLPSFARSQDQKGFEITGHVDGVQDGEKVVLLHYPFTWIVLSALHPLPVDSCIVKNGQFYFKGVDSSGGPIFIF